MAEEILLAPNATKAEKYEAILPQLEALISHETDKMANIGNILAVLKYEFHFFWVGLYLVKNEELVLNQFQGPLACTRIKYGKGVCGAAWQQAKTILVPDVEAFPGHIACSSLTQSEIVLPLFQNQEIIGVLDVDSELLSFFDEVDAQYLEKIALLMVNNL